MIPTNQPTYTPTSLIEYVINPSYPFLNGLVVRYTTNLISIITNTIVLYSTSHTHISDTHISHTHISHTHISDTHISHTHISYTRFVSLPPQIVSNYLPNLICGDFNPIIGPMLCNRQRHVHQSLWCCLVSQSSSTMRTPKKHRPQLP